jgi:hypothetical protein
MKIKIISIALLTCFFLLGCGTASKEIRSKSISTRTDVFREVQREEAPPKEFSDLLIKAQIKTHPEGYYLLESKNSYRGKGLCLFLVNVDGQAVAWEVAGKEEDTPAYDKNRVTIPDGGKGMRYVLEKMIRLHTGRHEIFFALPGESYRTMAEVVLKGGTQNILEFRPVYRNNRPSPSYLKGISRYDVFLNGDSVDAK